MEKSTNQVRLKFLTLGFQGVGKSSLIQRYCLNTFSKNIQSTTGMDRVIKHLNIDSVDTTVVIWDTSGQEKFNSIAKSSFQGTDGFLVVYSVTDKESFDKINIWISSISENCDKKEYEMVLIGNKSDYNERAISTKQGQSLASKYGVPFYETSALDGTNVDEAITNLATICFKKLQNMDNYFLQLEQKIKLQQIHQKQNSKKKTCC